MTLTRDQQRRRALQSAWDRRAGSWHSHVNDTEAFRAIRDAVLARAAVGSDDEVVDLGAGTGFVTVPLAQRAKKVLAVDLSAAMLAKIDQADSPNIQIIAADIAAFDLPARSVDVVVSNYALHHLTDIQKAKLLHRAHRWLRPGGRIVIADMMLGRGLTARDRAIARAKVRALIRRGPGGLWRVAKNSVRFAFRIGSEQPLPPEQWIELLERAGFRNVDHDGVVAEAGLVWGEP